MKATSYNGITVTMSSKAYNEVGETFEQMSRDLFLRNLIKRLFVIVLIATPILAAGYLAVKAGW